MLLHLQMGAAHVRLGQFRMVEILRDLVCVSTRGNKKIGTPVASVSASSVQDCRYASLFFVLPGLPSGNSCEMF